MSIAWLVVLVMYLKVAFPVDAFDCSIQCPNGSKIYEVPNLAKENSVGCTLVGNNQYDPNSWCKATYSMTETHTCYSCDPITYKLATCMKRQNVVSPYEYWCDTVSEGDDANVPCCAPITTKSCGGSCGIAKCESGLDCTSNKCINTKCPSDTDCICDVDPPTPSCTVSITGDATVVSGTDHTYTATITGDGDPTTLTLSAPDFTPTSADFSGFASGSVTLTAPIVAANTTYTLTATGKTDKATCTSATKTVTVTIPAVNVAVRACNSTDMVTCNPCVEPSGFTGTFRLHKGATEFGGGPFTVGGSSVATFTNVMGGANTYVMSLTSLSTDWSIVAPDKSYPPIGDPWNTAGATYGPGGNYDFCVTQQSKPWWQVVGGDAYAPAVTSTVTPGINTLMAHYGGTTNSSGMLAATGEIDTTKVIVGPGTRNWAAAGSIYEAPKEGFNYFVRSFELGVAPVVDNPGGTIADDPGVDGAYYLEGDITTSALNLSNPVTDSRTYFITGNLTVDSDIIVIPGAFLAFVVKGNIIINGDVSQVQGMYIADKTLTIIDGPGSGAVGLDSPQQFEGQGTFVGWRGVVLNRDLDDPTITTDDLDNNQFPATKIIYRPDFLLNAPDGFKHNSILWQEIAP